MRQISEQQQNDNAAALGLSKFSGTWEPGRDYLRLDGKTSKTKRHEMVQMFNNPNDKRMRCFLISSKAGELLRIFIENSFQQVRNSI
jgi:transcriptional regulator ATRX